MTAVTRCDCCGKLHESDVTTAASFGEKVGDFCDEACAADWIRRGCLSDVAAWEQVTKAAPVYTQLVG